MGAGEGERDPPRVRLRRAGRIARGEGSPRPREGGPRRLDHGPERRVAREREVRGHLARERLLRPARRERPQRVEGEHVRRPLPDRQHLGVAQEPGDPGVLHVARPAEALDHLGGERDRLLRGGELRERGHGAQERAVGGGRLAALGAPEQRRGPEGEQERPLALGLEAGQGVAVQRLRRERGAEGDAASRVVPGEVERPPHARGRDHRVPRARDVEHRRDGADAVREPPHRGGPRAVERQLGGGELAGAELVLEPVHEDPVGAAVLVPRLDVEEGEAARAGGAPLGARQRERHLGGGGRAEPLRPEEPPASAVPPRDGLGAGHVRAPGALGHPLPARPRPGGIARGEPRHGAGDEGGVAGGEQRPRRAVGHGERAGVDVDRRLEHVDHRHLVQPGERPVPPLVRGGHEAVARRERRRLAPERGELDAVHAAPPRVPLHEARLRLALGLLQLEQPAPRELAELEQLRLDLPQGVGRQRAGEVLAEEGVGGVRVREPRRVLEEGHVRRIAARAPPRARSTGRGAAP